MVTAEKYVAFDLGAESGRVMLGSLADGHLRLEEIHRFANNPVTVLDSLHWNVLDLWEEIKHGLGIVAARHGRELAGIGLDTWGVDFALLDRYGALLCLPYHYRDSRTEGITGEISHHISEWELYRRTGIPFLPISTLCQLMAMSRRGSPALDAADARLRVTFNVELGRGYMPAGSSNGLPVGSIPIDAVFSPVRKANCTVETSGFGEGSGQERLVLEVWTDSTLSPTEAVSQSAAILIEQYSCFRELAKTLTEDGSELAWQRLIPPEQYDMPLDQLNLSTHTYNSLRRGGITTLGMLLEKTGEGLSSLAGFGAKSQEEVETALGGLNLPFVPEIKKQSKKSKRAKEQEEDVTDTETEVTEE